MAAPLDQEIVQRWKDGEKFGSLAREIGLSRSAFRRKIYAAVGGKDKYKELREKGAGGSRGGSSSKTEVDDTNVPTVTEDEISFESKVIYRGSRQVSESLFIAPDGTEYVNASGNQAADLIVEIDTPGIPNARLRKIT